jgi:hypothetical protein
MYTCLGTIRDTNRVVKSTKARNYPQRAGLGNCGQPGTSISWATPGETTQAGIRQGAGGELSKLSAGSSQKLIELPLPRGSFSIGGAVRWLLPRVGTSSKEYPGP